MEFSDSEIDRKELQIQLEQLFNKNQLIPRLRAEFEKESDGYFVQKCIEAGISPTFGIDAMVHISLHKQADLPTMLGVLQHHFEDIQTVADMLYKACEIDLLDWDDALEKFVFRYEVSPDVQEELDRYQFPLPAVTKPKHVGTNRDTGFYTSGGSIILKQNHHNDDVCLDHINRMNSIKLTINQEVMKFISNKWRNLDKMKPGESTIDFRKRKKAFEKYDRVTRSVCAYLVELGNELFLTHSYDKRGRTYCRGYHVTYQGNAWNKAVIELRNTEIVS